MIVNELHVRHFMGVRAVDVTPKEAIVTIGGKNGQGKSSTLDAMLVALAGDRHMPADPVHHEGDEAVIEMTIGDYKIRKRIKKGKKPTLEVRAADTNAKFDSPQSLLNSLLGRYTFDPLAFSKMKPAERREALLELVGLDLDQFEQRKAAAAEARRSANAEAARARAHKESIAEPDIPPGTTPVSVSDLADQLREANAEQSEADALKANAIAIEDKAKALDLKADAIDEQIAKLRAEQASLRKESDECVKMYRELCEKVKIKRAAMPDIEDIEKRLQGAEATNEKVRRWQEIAKAEKERRDAEARAAGCQVEINKINDEKDAAVAAASLPVAGLGFTAEGVTLNGVSFEQASTSEQIRTSVAMGLAMNPELRIMHIREGSLLDDDALAEIAGMAEQKGAQIWIEKVTSDPEGCTVLIEAGECKA